MTLFLCKSEFINPHITNRHLNTHEVILTVFSGMHQKAQILGGVGNDCYVYVYDIMYLALCDRFCYHLHQFFELGEVYHSVVTKVTCPCFETRNGFCGSHCFPYLSHVVIF